MIEPVGAFWDICFAFNAAHGFLLTDFFLTDDSLIVAGSQAINEVAHLGLLLWAEAVKIRVATTDAIHNALPRLELFEPASEFTTVGINAVMN